MQFAARAKRIKNKPEVNQFMDDQAMIRRFKEEIATLRKELEDVKNKDGSLQKLEILQMEREKMESERSELLNKIARLEDVKPTVPLDVTDGVPNDIQSVELDLLSVPIQGPDLSEMNWVDAGDMIEAEPRRLTLMSRPSLELSDSNVNVSDLLHMISSIGVSINSVQ